MLSANPSVVVNRGSVPPMRIMTLIEHLLYVRYPVSTRPVITHGVLTANQPRGYYCYAYFIDEAFRPREVEQLAKLHS